MSSRYQAHKEVIAQRYQENKEAIIKKQKKYYQDNKVQILAKVLARVNCGCGGVYSISNRLKHHKTIKHQRWVEP